MIIEIFTTGFFFAVFCLGALTCGLTAFFFKDAVWLSFIFVITSVVFFLTLKSWYFETVIKSKNSSNFGFQGLIGKVGIVTKTISLKQMGYVKVDGDEWQAVANQSIEEGTQVIIEQVEGNRVQVRKNEV